MGGREYGDPWVTSPATHTTSKLRPVLGVASSGREVLPVPWASGLGQWAESHRPECPGHSLGSCLQGAVSDVAEPAAAGWAPWETGPMPVELGLLGAAGTCWR